MFYSGDLWEILSFFETFSVSKDKNKNTYKDYDKKVCY